MSIRSTGIMWYICGTCLTDVWWELTDGWWGIWHSSDNHLTRSTRQIAIVWRKRWSIGFQVSFASLGLFQKKEYGGGMTGKIFDTPPPYIHIFFSDPPPPFYHFALDPPPYIHIVACKRGGVSNEPPGHRQETGPGILIFTKAGWAWHITIFMVFASIFRTASRQSY